MVKVLRREELEKGDIVLELREGKKRNIWHYRVRIIAHNDYIRKSSYTDEFGVAAQMAQKEYDDMKDRLRKQLPPVELTYKDLYREWFKAVGKHLSKHRQKSINEGHNTYLLPFFEKHRLSEITEKACTKYWSWRLAYWTTGPGKDNKKAKFYVKTPGGNTLGNERQSLLQVLRWGKEMGYLDIIPTMKSPIKRPKKKEIARPAFTYDEYEKITKWVIKRSDEYVFTKPKYSNDYGQAMFYNFVRLGFATGMRPNELFSLQWQHVDLTSNMDQAYTKLYVPEKTKTGKRTVIALPDALYALKNIQKFSRHTKPDDFVFTTWKGGKVRDYAKQYKRMLTDLDILKDMHGESRTPYSMRHSYITFRLLRGKVLVQDLARNCGHSITELSEHYDHVLNEQKADELTQDAKLKDDSPQNEIEKILAEILHKTSA